MSIFMGIDQSYTSTGIIIINDDDVVLLSKVLTSDKTKDNFDRAIEITDSILEIVNEHSPEYIAIEDLAFGSIGNATRQLSGLQYNIVISIRTKYNIPILIIPPTTLKKYATASGKSKKDMMFHHLPEHIKTILLSVKRTKGRFDLCDAYWLAKYNMDKVVLS